MHVVLMSLIAVNNKILRDIIIFTAYTASKYVLFEGIKYIPFKLADVSSKMHSLPRLKNSQRIYHISKR